ncbi:MAG: hypothetical protein M3177_04335 [Pseudomonadota bacterium]|nr:hypothetical protein [Pseudomonadota bacterium]
MLRQLSWIFIPVTCISCGATSSAPAWDNYQPPDWRGYQARNVTSPQGPVAHSSDYVPRREDRFSFRDLKTEGDESLAVRLLGQIGRRIAYIDRHRERWHLYRADHQGAENVDLYTRPYALGSQFGLCGVEKYSVEFDDEGRVESVTVNQRYGVEGPIFQKADFDWEHYSNVMCASVPATHAPSYFPATDALVADDAAALLIVLFDRAASPGRLPFSLQCRTLDERACSQDVRAYLGGLRLEDIDELSLVNCPLRNVPQNSVCFTIVTDQHEVGPFPKYITVKGSTYMNNVRVDSVEIFESFTMS